MPVLSQPDDGSWTGERGYVQVGKNVSLYKETCDVSWTGERDYVQVGKYVLTLLLLQAAFSKEKGIYSPLSTGAVLCGQKQMAEVSSYC